MITVTDALHVRVDANARNVPVALCGKPQIGLETPSVYGSEKVEELWVGLAS